MSKLHVSSHEQMDSLRHQIDRVFADIEGSSRYSFPTYSPAIELLDNTLVQRHIQSQNIYLALTKSFLLWSFTLAVCLLVVGFPIQVILATIGILATVILQAVLPSSAVLLVVGSIVTLNLAIVFVGATILTVKGIHPQEVTWLHWLHGQSASVNNPVYASCPLTCALN